MTNKFRIPLTYSLVYVMISLGRIAEAVTFDNPISAQSFPAVVLKFAQLLAQIGTPIAAIFLIWSGFLFVTARGNEEQLKKAKNTFYWTVLGTAVVIGAYAIASAVVNFAQQL